MRYRRGHYSSKNTQKSTTTKSNYKRRGKQHVFLWITSLFSERIVLSNFPLRCRITNKVQVSKIKIITWRNHLSATCRMRVPLIYNSGWRIKLCQIKGEICDICVFYFVYCFVFKVVLEFQIVMNLRQYHLELLYIVGKACSGEELPPLPFAGGQAGKSTPHVE